MCSINILMVTADLPNTSNAHNARDLQFNFTAISYTLLIDFIESVGNADYF